METKPVGSSNLSFPTIQNDSGNDGATNGVDQDSTDLNVSSNSLDIFVGFKTEIRRRSADIVPTPTSPSTSTSMDGASELLLDTQACHDTGLYHFKPSDLNKSESQLRKIFKNALPESYLMSGDLNMGRFLAFQNILASVNFMAKIMKKSIGLGNIKHLKFTIDYLTSPFLKDNSDYALSKSTMTDYALSKSTMTDYDYLEFLDSIKNTTTDPHSHLSRSYLDWKNVTKDDIENGIKKFISEHPEKEIVVHDMYEKFHEGTNGKIPISIKAEFHVAGEVSSHGVNGCGEIQKETVGFLKKIVEQNDNEFTRVATSSQHALGAGATGVNPRTPKVANTYFSTSEPNKPRIPGGSTSGGTTSVSAGVMPAAIGSDGGGSGRICPALQGVVGSKCGLNCMTGKNDFFDLTGGSYNDPNTLVQPAVVSNNIYTNAKVTLSLSNSRPSERCKKYKELNVVLDTDALNMLGKENAIADRCSKMFHWWKTKHPDRNKYLKSDFIEFNQLKDHPKNFRTLGYTHIILFAREERYAFENCLTRDQRRHADPELKLNMKFGGTFTEEEIHIAEQNRDVYFIPYIKYLKENGIDVIVFPTTLKTARIIMKGEQEQGLGDLLGALNLSSFTCLANLCNKASITDRKSTRLNSVTPISRMPSSA